MSNSEQHEMLCGILTKLVDSDLTSDELSLLAKKCDVDIKEFYGSQPDLLIWQPELPEYLQHGT